MRAKRAAVAAAAAVFVFLPSASAEDRQELEFSGSDAGGDYWFNVRDHSGRNPEVVLRPGDEVWVDVRNAGRQDHNLRFAGPVDEAVELMPPGHMLAMRFVVPDEEGVYEYWCDPHRELGMRGQFRIAAGADDAQAPAPAAFLGLVLAALLWGRRMRGDFP